MKFYVTILKLVHCHFTETKEKLSIDTARKTATTLRIEDVGSSLSSY